MLGIWQSGGKRLVVVLGMHRSGTSLCANMLHMLGVDMAEGPGASPHNQRGHWERARINDLNDQVFEVLSRRWTDEAHALALPPGWLDVPKVRDVQSAMETFMRAVMAVAPLCGFKDPRTARLLPLWRLVFAALGAVPRFVVCVRDPAQVARSLSARDKMAREKAEYRWVVYNAELVRGVGGAPVCLVPYEDWFARPGETAARLATFLDRPEPGADAVNAVIDPSLRHDTALNGAASAMARRLHRLMMRAAVAGRFDADAMAFCACLAEFEQLVQPLLVDMEVLRGSVSAQNRVINDLNALVRTLRSAAA